MESFTNTQLEHQRKVIYKLMCLLHKEKKSKQTINDLLNEIIEIAKKKKRNVVFNLNVFQPPNNPDDDGSSSDEDEDEEDEYVDVEMDSGQEEIL